MFKIQEFVGRLPQVGLLCCVAVGLCAASPFTVHAAQSVKVGWNPSPDPTVSGYNLYYGPSSGAYSTLVSAGTNTVVAVTNLQAGATYYFAATAYNQLGLESQFSSELAYNVPTTIPNAVLLVQTNGSPDVVLVTSSAGAMQRWTLLQSADGVSWSTLTAGTNSAVNVTLGVTNAPNLYLRLKQG